MMIPALYRLRKRLIDCRPGRCAAFPSGETASALAELNPSDREVLRGQRRCCKIFDQCALHGRAAAQAARSTPSDRARKRLAASSKTRRTESSLRPSCSMRIRTIGSASMSSNAGSPESQRSLPCIVGPNQGGIDHHGLAPTYIEQLCQIRGRAITPLRVFTGRRPPCRRMESPLAAIRGLARKRR